MGKRMYTAVLCLCLGLAGCAVGTWGSMAHNTDLMAAYKNKGLAENYTYYYCGRSGIPYAVVGIDPAYTFESRFWFKIESRDEVYRKIDRLSNLEAFHSLMYAKDILSPSGDLIGTWFSYYNTTAVTIEENRMVTVYSPYKPESRFGSVD